MLHDRFLDQTIGSFQNLRTSGANEAVRRHTYLVLGPWRHGLNEPYEGWEGLQGRPYFNTLQEQWRNYWLKGEKGDIESWPAVRAWIEERRQWVFADQWPPKETQNVRFYLGQDGLSMGAPPRNSGSKSYGYDPDGTQLFGTPQGEFLKLSRQPPAP